MEIVKYQVKLYFSTALDYLYVVTFLDCWPRSEALWSVTLIVVSWKAPIFHMKITSSVHVYSQLHDRAFPLSSPPSLYPSFHLSSSSSPSSSPLIFPFLLAWPRFWIHGGSRAAGTRGSLTGKVWQRTLSSHTIFYLDWETPRTQELALTRTHNHTHRGI